MNRPPPSAMPDDVDLAALWRAVADRKSYLFGVALTAGLLTFIALQFVTPLYTSQARILIEHDELGFMRPRAQSANADRRTLLDPEAVASQVQVLLSRDLAYHVVKARKLEDKSEFNTPSGPGAALKKIFVTLGLARAPTRTAREERALDAFEKRLSVYQVAKSRVIAVEFDSWDAQLAAGVANDLAEVYLTWQQKVKLEQTKDATHWLNEQIKTLREEVAASEAAIEKYRSSSGIIAGSNNITLDAQQLSELNSQLILARAQRSEAEARAALIRKMLQEKGDVASAPDVLRSTLIQRLLEQHVRVRRELAELSATLLPSHPRIRQLNSESADLRRQIRQEAKKVVSSLENEAQISGAREASLRSSLDELKTRTSATRADEIKLRSLEREAKANRDLLESYLARYGEANARGDESAVPAHASIISRAHVESEPSFPKKGPVSALVAAAVGLLALAGVIGRELVTGSHGRTNRNQSSGLQYEPREEAWEEPREEAWEEPREEEAEPIPVPCSAAGHKRRRPLRAKSARAAAKIMRGRHAGGLAHNIIVAADNHHANSAQDTIDVGRAMAKTGLEVAIIDFSSSGPGVAGLIGLSNIPGLGELLGGTAQFEDVISADPQGTLQVIPSGVRQHDGVAPEEQVQWHRVHSALSQTYDCVLLHMSLSGAKSLAVALPPERATLMLVTKSKVDAAHLQEVAEYLTGNVETCPDIVTYDGVRRGRQPKVDYGLGGEAALAG